MHLEKVMGIIKDNNSKFIFLDKELLRSEIRNDNYEIINQKCVTYFDNNEFICLRKL